MNNALIQSPASLVQDPPPAALHSGLLDHFSSTDFSTLNCIRLRMRGMDNYRADLGKSGSRCDPGPEERPVH